MSKKLDAVTYSILESKFHAICEAQRLTITLMSGSPIITDAFDFNNGVFLPDGRALEIGLRYTPHADSCSSIVRSTIKDCRDNPGFEDGDQFFCNDPWKGAIHQNDIAVSAPIFYNGEIVAWTSALGHQIDVGGPEFGSWNVEATSVYQEAVPIPPVKLISKGKMRNDVWNVLLAHSKLPFMFGLDLKAFIGANNVARERFVKLIERYGLETVKIAMEEVLAETETKLRNRLKEIPDGIYRSRLYYDHDGRENIVYRTLLTVTKDGDNITFDFTGTSKQALALINNTEASTRGAVAAAITNVLCFDIPWTGGVYKPIKVITQPGTTVNVIFPGGTGGAPIFQQFVTWGTTIVALSKMFGCTEKYKNEQHVLPNMSWITINLFGKNQYGEDFGTMLSDVAAGGRGAWAMRDGEAASMLPGCSTPQVPDIETEENAAPILYLYRRTIADSQGPGKFDGGKTAGMAFMLYDTDAVRVVLMGQSVQAPVAGMYGGMPGSCCVNEIVRESNIDQILEKKEMINDVDELEGEKTVFEAKVGGFDFFKGDVLKSTWQAGQGYGDPLKRKPEMILMDVINGGRTIKWAKRIYGLIIDPETNEINERKTNEERKKIVDKRLSLAEGVTKVDQVDATNATVLMPMGEYLEVIEINGQKLIRCECGYQFGPIEKNWKEYAIQQIASTDIAGPLVLLHQDLQMRVYYCPECGCQLDVEIAHVNDEPLFDIELKR